jgi:hypothetical protein
MLLDFETCESKLVLSYGKWLLVRLVSQHSTVVWPLEILTQILYFREASKITASVFAPERQPTVESIRIKCPSERTVCAIGSNHQVANIPTDHPEHCTQPISSAANYFQHKGPAQSPWPLWSISPSPVKNTQADCMNTHVSWPCDDVQYYPVNLYQILVVPATPGSCVWRPTVASLCVPARS